MIQAGWARSATLSGLLAIAAAVVLAAAPAGAVTISFSGIDAQSQYTGYSGPPGPDTPGIFTFDDTVNGANLAPEPGVVTAQHNIAGLLGGVINLEMMLDTTGGYDPATDQATIASFMGTGGNEVTIWDATQTTLLLSFDLSYVDVRNISALGTVNNLVRLGDAEGSLVPNRSLLTVTGGSLAGTVGGLGTQAVLDIVINDPNPALPDDLASAVAGYPGFWNDSFTSGIAGGSTPEAGVNWAITIIPEPGTGSLLGLALLGLAGWRRSQRNRS